MNALARGGWLLSAVAFGALLASFAHVDYAGRVPFAILIGVAIVSCLRPAWALPAVIALVPVAHYVALRWWNPRVAWAEALGCAALVGLSLAACRERTAVPRRLAAPALVFASLVTASLVAALYLLALRFGPAFWPMIGSVVGHDYFTDHSLTALHAGLLLLEGTALFAHAARLGTQAGFLRRVCAAIAAGSAAAALATLARLAEAATRGPSFWRSLIDLASQLRWNVHYDDFNAAGSYYALALLAAAAMAVGSRGWRRAIWSGCAVLGAVALWLTSSRIAVLAAPAAAAAALLLPLAIRSRRQAAIAGLTAAGLCVALAVVGVFLPQRGIQQSSSLAIAIRLGLIETGGRMLRAYPLFGIGLGEFQQRSGEFSSPDLLATFPPAVHENAHNNLVQVAAETGLAGGLAFTWTIGVALLAVAWRATATRDRYLQLVLAALLAFGLTALAGHPLLVAEVSFAFWILAGAAGGSALQDLDVAPRTRRSTLVVAAAIALVAATLPLRLRQAARDADFEHVGFGVSAWQTSPDDIRYRQATGHATFFVPAGAFRFNVNLRDTTATAQLEVSLDGRPANILLLLPYRWTTIVIPARGAGDRARFRRMDLRTVGDENAILWVSKYEPVVSR